MCSPRGAGSKSRAREGWTLSLLRAQHRMAGFPGKHSLTALHNSAPLVQSPTSLAQRCVQPGVVANEKISSDDHRASSDLAERIGSFGNGSTGYVGALRYRFA